MPPPCCGPISPDPQPWLSSHRAKTFSEIARLAPYAILAVSPITRKPSRRQVHQIVTIPPSSNEAAGATGIGSEIRQYPALTDNIRKPMS